MVELYLSALLRKAGEIFDQVKHLLQSRDERKFTPVKGVDGFYHEEVGRAEVVSICPLTLRIHI